MQIIILFKQQSNHEFFYRNKSLCLELIKNFKNIKFLNLYGENNFNVSKKYKKYFVKVKKFKDLKNFFHASKKYICISFVKKNLQNIEIFRLLKIKNVTLVEIFREGDLRDTKYFFNLNFLDNLKKINKIILININFIIYFLSFRFNILPKTDFLFHYNKNSADQIGYCFSDSYKYSLFSILKKFFFKKNIFFKNIYLVKVKSDENFKQKIKSKKKYIIFLDSCFDHPDRSEYDSKPTIIEKKKYYIEINETFKKIKNFIFLLHPNSDYLEIKKYLKNILIVKYKTRFFLMRSKLVFFHESSSIIEAIHLKKKIISLDSDFLGKYFKFRNKLYYKTYNFKKINLSDKKNKLKNIKSNVSNFLVISKLKKKNLVSNNINRIGIKDIVNKIKNLNKVYF